MKKIGIPAGIAVALWLVGGTGRADEPPWTTTANKSLKGANGRMTVTLPKGTEYVFYVYRSGAERLSVGKKYGSAFTLPPGLYDIVINKGGSDTAKKWRVRGIPIERGKDTRVHAGVLNVVSAEGMWQVYDENRTTIITGGKGPGKVGLAAGNYVIKISGEFSPVVIKDGQVTDF
jgi:hypothetical protein